MAPDKTRRASSSIARGDCRVRRYWMGIYNDQHTFDSSLLFCTPGSVLIDNFAPSVDKKRRQMPIWVVWYAFVPDDRYELASRVSCS